MKKPNQGKVMFLQHDSKNGGYMLLIDEKDSKTPLSLYAWDAFSRADIHLDHNALKAIAEAFTEYTGKRGIDNGKEERLYS